MNAITPKGRAHQDKPQREGVSQTKQTNEMGNYTMRTTHKQFAEQVRTHIKERLLDKEELKDGYDIETTDETLLYHQLKVVHDEFNSWYGPYERKRLPNLQDAFIDWLKGLPSCLSVEYTYYNINQAMKEWFENCGETYKQPKDEPYAYWHLIRREFLVLCKQNNIPRQ